MSDSEQPAIKIDKVSKSFKLPHEKTSSLKSKLINFHHRGYEMQQALKDVSFEIKKGEFFGIVGRNGSGKSTLLKIIAGIYTPTEGQVQINGSLAPFIELGVGFNPELTGRENVFLNGALLGFTRSQMRAMYDEIVEFAELERFMDQSLKNYSSGMQVRLAFSIAIRAKADILLLDEVLAVGDAAFQQKCNDYFASLKRDKQTIVLVSHNMMAVEKYCQRALLLEDSKIMKIGNSAEIAGLYEDMILKEEAAKAAELNNKQKVDTSVIESTVKVTQDGKAKSDIKAFTPFQIEITLKSKRDVQEAIAGVSIRNSEGQIVMAIETNDYIGFTKLKKGSPVKLTVTPENIFSNGTHYITLAVGDNKEPTEKQLFKHRNIASFTVYGIRKNANSVVHPHCKVEQV